MTPTKSFYSLILVISALASSSLWAQWATIDPDHIDIDVEQFEIKAVSWSDTYPDTDGFGQGGQESWLRLTVQYSLKFRDGRQRSYEGDSFWIDRVQFLWSVIIAPISKGDIYDDRKAVRLERAVTYRNVEIGKRRYYAVMYIDARTLRRYAPKIKEDDIMTRLVVKVNNKTQEEMAAKGRKFGTDTKDRRRMSGQGRRGNDIFDSEDIIRPGFGLLTRLESPWFMSAYDSFETIEKAE